MQAAGIDPPRLRDHRVTSGATFRRETWQISESYDISWRVEYYLHDSPDCRDCRVVGLQLLPRVPSVATLPRTLPNESDACSGVQGVRKLMDGNTAVPLESVLRTLGASPDLAQPSVAGGMNGSHVEVFPITAGLGIALETKNGLRPHDAAKRLVLNDEVYGVRLRRLGELSTDVSTSEM
jgi:hypothetical protein